MPALDHINKDGTKYEIVPEIAPLFNTSTAYAVGDWVIKDAVLYRFKTAHSAGAWNSSEVDAINLSEEVTNLKQDFNEYHPDLGSGYSAQLLSTVFIEDETPYNFRTSGGSADIGDREYDEIVGVSMPINQYVDKNTLPTTTTVNGVTYTNNGDGSITVNGTATDNSRLDNIIPIRTWLSHKYLLSGCPSGGSIQSYSLVLRGQGADVFDFGNGVIWDASVNSYKGICIYVTSGTVNNLKFVPQFTDLTLMLGTQIADHVYSLETATAGSGVTWLKHHFPKIFDSGYIPYTAGEMQSVSGLSAHRMTGFNQFDKSKATADSSINSQGAVVSGSFYVSDFIKVVPGATYYVKNIEVLYHVRSLVFYDAEKNLVSVENVSGGDDIHAVSFEKYIPSNVQYIRIGVHPSYIDSACVNLHWDGERDGEYEEYKEYVYPLDDSVVLRGKLELDSDNKLRANGDRYLPDGTVERRFGVYTITGGETWIQWGQAYYINALSLRAKDSNHTINCISDKLPGESSDALYSGNAGVAARGSAIYIDSASYSSLSSLTGMKVVYELATATTETAEPYQTPQIVDDWGTEEYVSTSLVPVGHDTKYANNLRAKLEMSPDSPEEDGDYIVRHNNGENEYVALGSTTTIQGILDRLTALENA